MPAGRTRRRPAAALLALAHRGLAEASPPAAGGSRYATAHLAALRGAAAAGCGGPAATRGQPGARPTSGGCCSPRSPPSSAEWAGFFAAGAAKRAAAEAGLPRAVTAREADDLLRDAAEFLRCVEDDLTGGGAASGWPPSRCSCRCSPPRPDPARSSPARTAR